MRLFCRQNGSKMARFKVEDEPSNTSPSTMSRAIIFQNIRLLHQDNHNLSMTQNGRPQIMRIEGSRRIKRNREESVRHFLVTRDWKNR